MIEEGHQFVVGLETDKLALGRYGSLQDFLL
jgi:hypothetical protein